MYFEFLLTISEICVLSAASCACGADAGGVRGGGGTQLRESGMQSTGYKSGGHLE